MGIGRRESVRMGIGMRESVGKGIGMRESVRKFAEVSKVRDHVCVIVVRTQQVRTTRGASTCTRTPVRQRWDTALPTQADWPAMKEDAGSAPARCFGSMPVIDHAGVLIAQSQATA
eukprot:gene757-1941_t